MIESFEEIDSAFFKKDFINFMKRRQAAVLNEAFIYGLNGINIPILDIYTSVRESLLYIIIGDIHEFL